jgi:hypothetical protein
MVDNQYIRNLSNSIRSITSLFFVLIALGTNSACSVLVRDQQEPPILPSATIVPNVKPTATLNIPAYPTITPKSTEDNGMHSIEPLLAVNYSLSSTYPLRKCMEFALNSEIQVISMNGGEQIMNWKDSDTGYFFPRWHPRDQKLAYIEVDFSKPKETHEDSEYVRTFPGDQISIYDFETGTVEKLAISLLRTESLTPDKEKCDSMQGITRVDGWSPDGSSLIYRFYGRELLGEQFAIVNISSSKETILGQDIGSFDWINLGQEIIAMDTRANNFLVIDTTTGKIQDQIPYPPTSRNDWLPLIEWNRTANTFVSDAPSSIGDGISFWFWNELKDEWDNEVEIPATYPVQVWDTHSTTTLVCTSGDTGAELLVMDTEQLSLLNRIEIPIDTICRTMDRSLNSDGNETVSFLLEQSSIITLTFDTSKMDINLIDLSEYTSEVVVPEFNTKETFAPFWMDVNP